MCRIYSNKSIGFLRFIFLFGIFFILLSFPITAKASETGKESVISEVAKDETPLTAKLNLKAVALVKGKTYPLKVYNLADNQTVTFKSDAEDIASVSETGLVTGLDYGTALITVSVKNGNKIVSKLTCEITVGLAALSVKFTKQELALTVGQKISLKIILQPYNTLEEAKFLSKDSSIATVSTGGRITAKSVGTTTIYTLLDNGKYDECVITVSEEAIASDSVSSSGNDTASPVKSENSQKETVDNTKK